MAQECAQKLQNIAADVNSQVNTGFTPLGFHVTKTTSQNNHRGAGILQCFDCCRTMFGVEFVGRTEDSYGGPRRAERRGHGIGSVTRITGQDFKASGLKDVAAPGRPCSVMSNRTEVGLEYPWPGSGCGLMSITGVAQGFEGRGQSLFLQG